eukprot:356754-Chlamydomonas_euryale.AAC.5
MRREGGGQNVRALYTSCTCTSTWPSAAVKSKPFQATGPARPDSHTTHTCASMCHATHTTRHHAPHRHALSMYFGCDCWMMTRLVLLARALRHTTSHPTPCARTLSMYFGCDCWMMTRPCGSSRFMIHLMP